MLAFNPDDRISSFALFNNLKTIMDILDNAQQMSLEQKSYDSIFRFDTKNHDWFAQDFE